MNYVITSTPTQEMVDNSFETSLDTLRWNNEETKCIFKYEGSQPDCFSELTEYTYEEIMIELAKEEWQPGDM